MYKAEGGVIDRQNYLIGGATKLATKFAIKRGNTAINTTIGTYKKANKILTDLNKKKVHDFGSGTGVGTKQFTNKKVTSHEPFVPDEKIIKSGGKLPTYQNADDVLINEGKNSKDAVVNLNVLNVIEDPFERANVVSQIGELINNKGVAIITTRGKDVATQASKSKNAIPHLDGWLFGSGSNKTFQKGFSQKELEEYVQEILGKLFKIEKIPSKYGIGTSGVMITKLPTKRKTFSKGGEVERLGYESGDEVLGLSELEGVKPLETKSIDDQVTTMMTEEKVIVPEKKPIKTEENSLPTIELNNTISEEVINRIKINENDKLFYKDKNLIHDSHEGGNQTIGYGHKLTDKEVKKGEVYGYKLSTLTKEQAEDIFNRDLEIARADVDKLIDKDTTDPVAYGILVEMAHQIGGTNLPKFKEMLKAVNRKDYKEASNQMLWNYKDGKKTKTKWHKQTETRANSLANLMANIFVDKD
jgi:GH24 family phage-related lysozyme (muramidase)